MNITRCMMDAVWGKEPYTIKDLLLKFNRDVIKCKDIGKALCYPFLGPRLVKDLLGMGPVVDILMRSLEQGILIAFEKFDTFTSSQSDFSTVWKAHIKGVVEGYSLGGYHWRNTVITKFSTKTILFDRFMRGVELRVGSKSRTNQEISIEVMKFLMEKMEVDVKGKV